MCTSICSISLPIIKVLSTNCASIVPPEENNNNLFSLVGISTFQLNLFPEHSYIKFLFNTLSDNYYKVRNRER
jgi:hypothetical protein